MFEVFVVQKRCDLVGVVMVTAIHPSSWTKEASNIG